MFEKKCTVCGKVFPPGTPPAKKFCDDCAPIHNAEKKHEQNMRYKNRILAQKEQKPKTYALNQPRQLSAKDKQYCSKCIYRGRFSEDYLCNYFSMTLELRGCKAGYGCEKRAFASTPDGEDYRHCERCDAVFIGPKTMHLCKECLRKVRRENAKKATAARKEIADGRKQST